MTRTGSAEDMEWYYARADGYWSGIADWCEGAITPGEQLKTAERDAHELVMLIGSDPWRRQASVLEFGCGEGRLAGHLAKHFETYRGVDISNECVKRCSSCLAPNASFEKINRPSDIPQNSVDCIVSWTVLEHMPHWALVNVLSDLVRSIKTGGYLCFQLDVEGHPERYRYDMVPDENLWNGRWYPQEWLDSILQLNGLTVLSRPSAWNEPWSAIKTA